MVTRRVTDVAGSKEEFKKEFRDKGYKVSKGITLRRSSSLRLGKYSASIKK